MHLHGLKLLIVVCIILGQIPNILSLGEKSPRTYFKEVADFDDIVEETDKRDEKKKVTFTNNVTMVPDSAGIFPQARVKQDVNFIEIQDQTEQINQDQVKPENLEILPQNIGIYPQFIYPRLQFGQRVNTFQVQNQADQVEQVTQTDQIKLETIRIFHQPKVKERVNIDQMPEQADQTDKFNQIEPKIIFTKKLGQPKTYRKKTKLNKFDKPELYVIRKIPSPRGYYVMKNKQINYLNEDLENQGKRVKSNINRYHPEEPDVTFPFEPSIETAGTTLQPPEISGNDDSDSCNLLFQLFQEIPIINDMLKELVEGKPTRDINTTWKTIKCVIKQQPDNSQKDLIDKPEGKICFRKFIRNHRRRRRHSTYLNFRNKRKRINNSLAKRNVEDDPRFKSIIDFIVKNKIFLDKYTYVPIVFSKITQDKNEGRVTGSINNNQTTLSAEQLAKISCAECSNQEVESTEIPSSTISKRGVLSVTEIPTIKTEQRDVSPFVSTPNRVTVQRNSNQLLLSPQNPNLSNISDIVQYVFSELPRDINKQEYYFTPRLYSQQIPVSNTSRLKNVVEPTREDDTTSNSDNTTSEENDKTSDTNSGISETFTNPIDKTTETVNMVNETYTETFTEPSDKANDADNIYQVFTLQVKREDNRPKTSVSCIPSTPVPSPSVACIPLQSTAAAPLSVPVSTVCPPAPVLVPPVQAINSPASIIPLQNTIAGNLPTPVISPIQNDVVNKDLSGSSTPFIVIGRRNISEDIYFKLPDFKRTINQTAKIIKDSAGCRKRNVRDSNNCESTTPLVISELRNMSEEILFKIPNLKRDLQNNDTIPNLQSVNRLKKDVDSEEYEEFEESDVGRNPDKRTANDTTTEEPIKLQLTENLGTTCIPVTALLSNTTGSGRNNSSNETISKINETLVPSEAMPTENTNLGEIFVFEKSTETNNNNSNVSTVKIDNNTTTIDIKNNSNTSTLNDNTVDIKSTMNISTVTIINTGVTELKTTEMGTNNTSGAIGLNKTSDTGPSEIKSANIVGAAKSNTSALTFNLTSSNNTSNLSQNITSTTTEDKHMIPGVLIYPINGNEKPQQLATKAKRSIFEETDAIDTFTYTNSALNEIESITIEDPLLNINRKYIDFNPLSMMKKEAKIDSNETNCQKETEMILDTLKSLNLNPPSEASSPESASIPPTSAYNDQSNLNTPTVSNMNMNNFNVNPTAASNPSGFSQPNFSINSNLQPVQVSWQVSPNLSPNMGLGETNMPVISKSETPITTVSTSISIETTAGASTTVSTIGSSAQGDETSTAANTMTSSADSETDGKLEKLEKDLRLVNEVQNIIDGMYRMKHKVRKRAIANPIAIDPQIYKSLLEPKMHVTSPAQYSNVNPEKFKEVSGLGKILKWKYLKNKHRKKRRLRRKKRRKYKRLYPYRHRRFLEPISNVYPEKETERVFYLRTFITNDTSEESSDENKDENSQNRKEYIKNSHFRNFTNSLSTSTEVGDNKDEDFQNPKEYIKNSNFRNFTNYLSTPTEVDDNKDEDFQNRKEYNIEDSNLGNFSNLLSTPTEIDEENKNEEFENKKEYNIPNSSMENFSNSFNTSSEVDDDDKIIDDMLTKAHYSLVPGPGHHSRKPTTTKDIHKDDDWTEYWATRKRKYGNFQETANKFEKKSLIVTKDNTQQNINPEMYDENTRPLRDLDMFTEPFKWASRPDDLDRTTKKRKKGSWRDKFAKLKTSTAVPNVNWKGFNFTGERNPYTTIELTKTPPTTPTPTTKSTSEVSINLTVNTPPTEDIFDYDVLTTTSVLFGPVGAENNDVLGVGDSSEPVDLDNIQVPIDNEVSESSVSTTTGSGDDLDIDVDKVLKSATEATTVEDDIQDKKELFQIADELLEDFTATTRETTTYETEESFPHKINDNIPSLKKKSNVSTEGIEGLNSEQVKTSTEGVIGISEMETTTLNGYASSEEESTIKNITFNEKISSEEKITIGSTLSVEKGSTFSKESSMSSVDQTTVITEQKSTIESRINNKTKSTLIIESSTSESTTLNKIQTNISSEGKGSESTVPSTTLASIDTTLIHSVSSESTITVRPSKTSEEVKPETKVSTDSTVSTIPVNILTTEAITSSEKTMSPKYVISEIQTSKLTQATTSKVTEETLPNTKSFKGSTLTTGVVTTLEIISPKSVLSEIQTSKLSEETRTKVSEVVTESLSSSKQNSNTTIPEIVTTVEAITTSEEISSTHIISEIPTSKITEEIRNKVSEVVTEKPETLSSSIQNSFLSGYTTIPEIVTTTEAITTSEEITSTHITSEIPTSKITEETNNKVSEVVTEKPEILSSSIQNSFLRENTTIPEIMTTAEVITTSKETSSTHTTSEMPTSKIIEETKSQVSEVVSEKPEIWSSSKQNSFMSEYTTIPEIVTTTEAITISEEISSTHITSEIPTTKITKETKSQVSEVVTEKPEMWSSQQNSLPTGYPPEIVTTTEANTISAEIRSDHTISEIPTSKITKEISSKISENEIETSQSTSSGSSTIYTTFPETQIVTETINKTTEETKTTLSETTKSSENTETMGTSEIETSSYSEKTIAVTKYYFEHGEPYVWSSKKRKKEKLKEMVTKTETLPNVTWKNFNWTQDFHTLKLMTTELETKLQNSTVKATTLPEEIREKSVQGGTSEGITSKPKQKSSIRSSEGTVSISDKRTTLGSNESSNEPTPTKSTSSEAASSSNQENVIESSTEMKTAETSSKTTEETNAKLLNTSINSKMSSSEINEATVTSEKKGEPISITKYYFEHGEPYLWSSRKHKKEKLKEMVTKTETLPNVTWKNFNWTQDFHTLKLMTTESETKPLTSNGKASTLSEQINQKSIQSSTSKEVSSLSKQEQSTKETLSSEKPTTLASNETSKEISSTIPTSLINSKEGTSTETNTVVTKKETTSLETYASALSEHTTVQSSIETTPVETQLSHITEDMTKSSEVTSTNTEKTGISTKETIEDTKLTTEIHSSQESEVASVLTSEKTSSSASSINLESVSITKTETPATNTEANNGASKESSISSRQVRIATESTSAHKTPSSLNSDTIKSWKKFSWPTQTFINEEILEAEAEKLRNAATSTTIKKFTTKTTTTIKSFLEAEEQSGTEITGIYIPEETTTHAYFSDFFLFTEKTPKEINAEEVQRKLASKNLNVAETIGTILPKFSETSDREQKKLHSVVDNLLKDNPLDNTEHEGEKHVKGELETKFTDLGSEILTGTVMSNFDLRSSTATSTLTGKPDATPLRSEQQQVQTPPKSEETTILSYKNLAKVAGNKEEIQIEKKSSTTLSQENHVILSNKEKTTTKEVSSTLSPEVEVNLLTQLLPTEMLNLITTERDLNTNITNPLIDAVPGTPITLEGTVQYSETKAESSTFTYHLETTENSKYSTVNSKNISKGGSTVTVSEKENFTTEYHIFDINELEENSTLLNTEQETISEAVNLKLTANISKAFEEFLKTTTKAKSTKEKDENWEETNLTEEDHKNKQRERTKSTKSYSQERISSTKFPTTQSEKSPYTEENNLKSSEFNNGTRNDIHSSKSERINEITEPVSNNSDTKDLPEDQYTIGALTQMATPHKLSQIEKYVTGVISEIEENFLYNTTVTTTTTLSPFDQFVTAVISEVEDSIKNETAPTTELNISEIVQESIEDANTAISQNLNKITEVDNIENETPISEYENSENEFNFSVEDLFSSSTLCESCKEGVSSPSTSKTSKKIKLPQTTNYQSQRSETKSTTKKPTSTTTKLIHNLLVHTSSTTRKTKPESEVIHSSSKKTTAEETSIGTLSSIGVKSNNEEETIEENSTETLQNQTDDSQTVIVEKEETETDNFVFSKLSQSNTDEEQVTKEETEEIVITIENPTEEFEEENVNYPNKFKTTLCESCVEQESESMTTKLSTQTKSLEKFSTFGTVSKTLHTIFVTETSSQAPTEKQSQKTNFEIQTSEETKITVNKNETSYATETEISSNIASDKQVGKSNRMTQIGTFTTPITENPEITSESVEKDKHSSTLKTISDEELNDEKGKSKFTTSTMSEEIQSIESNMAELSTETTQKLISEFKSETSLSTKLKETDLTNFEKNSDVTETITELISTKENEEKEKTESYNSSELESQETKAELKFSENVEKTTQETTKEKEISKIKNNKDIEENTRPIATQKSLSEENLIQVTSEEEMPHIFTKSEEMEASESNQSTEISGKETLEIEKSVATRPINEEMNKTSNTGEITTEVSQTSGSEQSSIKIKSELTTKIEERVNTETVKGEANNIIKNSEIVEENTKPIATQNSLSEENLINVTHKEENLHVSTKNKEAETIETNQLTNVEEEVETKTTTTNVNKLDKTDHTTSEVTESVMFKSEDESSHKTTIKVKTGIITEIEGISTTETETTQTKGTSILKSIEVVKEHTEPIARQKSLSHENLFNVSSEEENLNISTKSEERATSEFNQVTEISQQEIMSKDIFKTDKSMRTSLENVEIKTAELSKTSKTAVTTTKVTESLMSESTEEEKTNISTKSEEMETSESNKKTEISEHETMFEETLETEKSLLPSSENEEIKTITNELSHTASQTGATTTEVKSLMSESKEVENSNISTKSEETKTSDSNQITEISEQAIMPKEILQTEKSMLTSTENEEIKTTELSKNSKTYVTTTKVTESLMSESKEEEKPNISTKNEETEASESNKETEITEQETISKESSETEKSILTSPENEEVESRTTTKLSKSSKTDVSTTEILQSLMSESKEEEKPNISTKNEETEASESNKETEITEQETISKESSETEKSILTSPENEEVETRTTTKLSKSSKTGVSTTEILQSLTSESKEEEKSNISTNSKETETSESNEETEITEQETMSKESSETEKSILTSPEKEEIETRTTTKLSKSSKTDVSTTEILPSLMSEPNEDLISNISPKNEETKTSESNKETEITEQETMSKEISETEKSILTSAENEEVETRTITEVSKASKTGEITEVLESLMPEPSEDLKSNISTKNEETETSESNKEKEITEQEIMSKESLETEKSILTSPENEEVESRTTTKLSKSSKTDVSTTEILQSLWSESKEKEKSNISTKSKETEASEYNKEAEITEQETMSKESLETEKAIITSPENEEVETRTTSKLSKSSETGVSTTEILQSLMSESQEEAKSNISTKSEETETSESNKETEITEKVTMSKELSETENSILTSTKNEEEQTRTTTKLSKSSKTDVATTEILQSLTSESKVEEKSNMSTESEETETSESNKETEITEQETMSEKSSETEKSILTSPENEEVDTKTTTKLSKSSKTDVSTTEILQSLTSESKEEEKSNISTKSEETETSESSKETEITEQETMSKESSETEKSILTSPEREEVETRTTTKLSKSSKTDVSTTEILQSLTSESKEEEKSNISTKSEETETSESSKETEITEQETMSKESSETEKSILTSPEKEEVETRTTTKLSKSSKTDVSTTEILQSLTSESKEEEKSNIPTKNEETEASESNKEMEITEQETMSKESSETEKSILTSPENGEEETRTTSKLSKSSKTGVPTTEILQSLMSESKEEEKSNISTKNEDTETNESNEETEITEQETMSKEISETEKSILTSAENEEVETRAITELSKAIKTGETITEVLESLMPEPNEDLKSNISTKTEETETSESNKETEITEQETMSKESSETEKSIFASPENVERKTRSTTELSKSSKTGVSTTEILQSLMSESTEEDKSYISTNSEETEIISKSNQITEISVPTNPENEKEETWTTTELGKASKASEAITEIQESMIPEPKEDEISNISTNSEETETTESNQLTQISEQETISETEKSVLTSPENVELRTRTTSKETKTSKRKEHSIKTTVKIKTNLTTEIEESVESETVETIETEITNLIKNNEAGEVNTTQNPQSEENIFTESEVIETTESYQITQISEEIKEITNTNEEDKTTEEEYPNETNVTIQMNESGNSNMTEIHETIKTTFEEDKEIISEEPRPVSPGNEIVITSISTNIKGTEKTGNSLEGESSTKTIGIKSEHRTTENIEKEENISISMKEAENAITVEIETETSIIAESTGVIENTNLISTEGILPEEKFVEENETTNLSEAETRESISTIPTQLENEEIKEIDQFNNITEKENPTTLKSSSETTTTKYIPEYPLITNEEIDINLFNNVTETDTSETEESIVTTTEIISEPPTEESELNIFSNIIESNKSEMTEISIENPLTTSTEISMETTEVNESVTETPENTEAEYSRVEDEEISSVGVHKITEEEISTIENITEEIEEENFNFPNIIKTTICESCKDENTISSVEVSGKVITGEELDQTTTSESETLSEEISVETSLETVSESTNIEESGSELTLPSEQINANLSSNIIETSTITGSTEELKPQLLSEGSISVQTNSKETTKLSEIEERTESNVTLISNSFYSEENPSESTLNKEQKISTKQTSTFNVKSTLNLFTTVMSTILEESEGNGIFNFTRIEEEITQKEEDTEEETPLQTSTIGIDLEDLIPSEEEKQSTEHTSKSSIHYLTGNEQVITHKHLHPHTSHRETTTRKTKNTAAKKYSTISTSTLHSKSSKYAAVTSRETIKPVHSTTTEEEEEELNTVPFMIEITDNILATLTEISPTTEVLSTEEENVEEETTENHVIEVIMPTTHRLTPKPKTVVVIVNNSGKKINKINETILEKILNKTLSEINLEYVDLTNISREGENETNTSKENDVLNTGKECKPNEFESNERCICDVDSYLHGLETKLNNIIDLNKLNCTKLISFRDGFTITNKTEALKRKKRSLLYLKKLDRSSNYIENDNVEDVLDDSYKITDSDLNILVYPGRRAKIFCGNSADKLLDNQNASIQWEFRKDPQQTVEVLQYHENPLVITNADIKTAGNYTCIKTYKNGQKENYTHELELITFPIYKIAIAMYYSVNDSCSLSDGDILFAYLPKIVGPVLCGRTGKLCRMDMDRPRCFSKDDSNYYNVSVIATMNDIYTVYPTIDDSQCNINCKLRAYSNLIKLVYKNAQNAKKIPVMSKLHGKLDFLSNVSLPYTDVSKPPRIITTCREGYGIEKFKERLCVLCPKQTYSADNEVYCTVCPAGQYQPQPGSSSCIPCTSPVEDAMCLRMLYSNTKQFKIYVSIGFGLIVLILALILMWKAGSSSNNHGSKSRYLDEPMRQRYQRRRNGRRVDAENPLTQPLLADKKRKSPPVIPPPDF